MVADRVQIPLFLIVFFVFGAGISVTYSFSTTTYYHNKEYSSQQTRSSLHASFQRDDITPSSLSSQDEIIRKDYDNCSSSTTGTPDRRYFLQQSSMLARSAFVSTAAATAVWNTAPAVAQESASDEIEEFKVIKTGSGLKYIELEEGTVGDSSKTPRYGQVCVISYTGYLQLPKDDTKRKFASQSGFLLKHGSGRLIAGLDEGIHTMKQGGQRRLLIPPKLGFVSNGLGPLPEMPWQRSTLNSLLEKMVEQQGGTLIYDVQLERFFDDEADQGYYEDDEISPEELAELNRRMNRKVDNVGGRALDAVGEAIEINNRPDDRPIV
jgi:FKBP-type peptidyl-prolyl cis-trans isomerase